MKMPSNEKLEKDAKEQLINYGFCPKCHAFGVPTPTNEVHCGNCGQYTLVMLRDLLK